MIATLYVRNTILQRLRALKLSRWRRIIGKTFSEKEITRFMAYTFVCCALNFQL